MQNIKFSLVKSEKELQYVKDLCNKVFSEDEARLVEDFYLRSPKKEKNLVFYAFDPEKNSCLGTVSLLDVLFRYGNIPIKAVEYGVAATDPDYQHQGINSRLSGMFFEECMKRNYNLVVLEGIPYFYRHLGFNYAVPMDKEMVDLKGIEFIGIKDINIRKATIDDVDFIYEKYVESAQKADICKLKEREIIQVQIGSYKSNTISKDYYIVEDSGKTKDEKVGYFVLDTSEVCLEISDIADNLSFATYESVLKFLQQELMPVKEKTLLFTNLPARNKFNKFLWMKGSKKVGRYAWQIRILDYYKFLKDILPILEGRIQSSVYRDEKIEFYFNNFKQLIHFSIDCGKISLEEKEWHSTWDVNLTPQGAVKLFFSHNTLDEILNFLPDCMVTDRVKGIIEVLFPKMEVHFYMNY